jgi:hypothetical protein
VTVGLMAGGDVAARAPPQPQAVGGRWRAGRRGGDHDWTRKMKGGVGRGCDEHAKVEEGRGRGSRDGPMTQWAPQ